MTDEQEHGNSPIVESMVIDATIYAEMQAYATQHDLLMSDVVAYAWRLYRDMSAMRDDYQVPRSSLVAWQAEHSQHVDDASEPLLQPCPHCNGMHPKGTVEQCPLKRKE